MDDRGFIFTTDATLALVVVIVLTTSIVSYQMVPAYMGEDHQHLQALADSALAVMEQDGTLNNAAVEAARNNTTGAQQILNNRLSILIPSDTAYNLNMKASNVVTATDDRGLTYSKDSVTKVRVISGPEEGWMGRAWYKIEKFEFINQTQNVTTTLWNFHNYITNFQPWYRDGDATHGNLASYYYWGSASGAANTPINITFSFPNGATINGARYLVGSVNQNRSGQGLPFGTTFNLNNHVYTTNANQFTFLYRRPPTGTYNYPAYNYQSAITSGDLLNGVNNFNLRFNNPVYNYIDNNRRGHTMPWFSIIGNYTTSFPVPKEIVTQRFDFNPCAGMSVRSAQDLDGNGIANEYGRIYNIDNGTLSSFTNSRETPWDDYRKQNAPLYQNGLPFVITGVSGSTGTSVTPTKSAISVVQDIYIPPGNKIFDAYTVVNAYGGVDGALVEVYNGSEWKTAFCSFNYDGKTYSSRSDGYGNIPGIVYLGDSDGLPYLMPGQTNKVRVTIWDDVPSGDYDLVGLVDCYSSVTYSALNVNWVNFPYNSHQSSNNIETQTRTFRIDEDAKEVFLFVGGGTDSRRLTVKYPGTGGATLYDSTTIPYYLDLAALDAALPVAQRKITTDNSTPTNYYLKQGTNYGLTVTIRGPNNAWESGDYDANAEIISGMRIAVIYPESLRNIWNIAYSSTAQAAMDKAEDGLIAVLNTTDPNVIKSIKTEALFTGDMPNQVPVRLDLWKQ